MGNRNRSGWTRERICEICGKQENVRKDNPAKRCSKCSRAEALKKARKAVSARKLKTSCLYCGVIFFTCQSIISQNKDKYCSRNCYLEDHRVKRSCKHCAKEFVIPKSKISGKSNSSGNYCSRECYEISLCADDEGQIRGSRWKQIRKEVLRQIPCCVICAKNKPLDVHHIVPYRLTQDNHQSNLIPLCKRCHYKVETITKSVEKTGIDFDIMKRIFRSILIEKFMVLAAIKRSGY